jgi:hypothetical protein
MVTGIALIAILKMLVELGRRKCLFCLIYCAFWGVVLIFAAEVALRMRGYGPWHPQTTSPELIEPKGKLSAKHPLLGYANLPGKFHVTLSGGHRWKVTHLSHGLRATHFVQSGKRKRSKKEIWILGCSFTYGWGVNDDETFAWLLQEKLPNYEVVNFGVCGYGTMHSLIQFREALKEREKPVTAVIVYASFHDERNTMLRSWRNPTFR